MSFGGPIAVNHLAVWEYLDRYEIDDPVGVFELVCDVSAKVINSMNEESKLEREAKK